jgi:hypothetical protein
MKQMMDKRKKENGSIDNKNNNNKVTKCMFKIYDLMFKENSRWCMVSKYWMWKYRKWLKSLLS